MDTLANNTPIGTLPDGRSYYDKNDFDGDGETFNTRRGYDMLLTNTDKGHGHTLSLSLNKKLPGGIQLFGAYAYQNVKELTPATSSRSVSNYGQAAVGLDPNNLSFFYNGLDQKLVGVEGAEPIYDIMA